MRLHILAIVPVTDNVKGFVLNKPDNICFKEPKQVDAWMVGCQGLVAKLQSFMALGRHKYLLLSNRSRQNWAERSGN